MKFEEKISKIEEIIMSLENNETDLENNKISNESPVGAALLGKKRNNVVDVQVPAGIVKLKILSIKK